MSRKKNKKVNKKRNCPIYFFSYNKMNTEEELAAMNNRMFEKIFWNREETLSRAYQKLYDFEKNIEGYDSLEDKISKNKFHYNNLKNSYEVLTKEHKIYWDEFYKRNKEYVDSLNGKWFY